MRGPYAAAHPSPSHTADRLRTTASTGKKKTSTHNIDVVSCARNREVLAIMREAQVRDRLSGIKCQLTLRGELNKDKTHSHTVIVRAAIHSLVSNKFTIESNPPEAR